VPAHLTPGTTLNVELAWQAMAPVDSDSVVFVHLLDAADRIVAQGDGVPVNGRYPTSAWDVGKRILDTHALALPSDLPEGEYRLIAGLYNPVDGSRVPLAQPERDFVLLDKLTIDP
jgi:hypothetical protein